MRTFGFHLYGLDLRQNSETHEATIAELFAWAGVCDDYAALDEDARVELLTAELANNRPLAGPNATFSETTTKELAITAAAAHAVRTFGEKAVPNHVISMCTSVSDMLETAVLLKEAGLLTVTPDGPRCSVNIVPLFETIEDLQVSATTLRAALAEHGIRCLVVPGVIGGVTGAYLLTSLDASVTRPFVMAYLSLIGLYLLWKSSHPAQQRKPRVVAPLGLVGGFLDAVGGGGAGRGSLHRVLLAAGLVAHGQGEQQGREGNAEGDQGAEGHAALGVEPQLRRPATPVLRCAPRPGSVRSARGRAPRIR